MLKKFVSYYRPYLKTFIFVMFCDLLISLISMAYPILTRQMMNDLIPNQKFKLIVIFGITLLVLYIIKAILKYLFDYYGHMVGTGIQKDMRTELFAKLEKLPFSYYDNHETGKVMARMTTDLFDIAELAHHGPENLFMAAVMISFSFVYLSSISLPLTLIIFACVPVLIITTTKVRKLHMVSSKKAKASQSIISARLNSSISGIRVTKAFDNGDIESEKFKKGNEEFVEAKKGQYKTMSMLHSSTTFITELFNVVCLISGGIFLYNGEITFGDYTAFMLSINVFISPILTLVNFTEVL
ncbi:MAG: ABC transporter ATP-binding protein, partial [Solobacterium sp.]|nr:ABC transporter ATP-binding protein [Solobacterium sp.]